MAEVPDDEGPGAEVDAVPTKSARKREMTARQRLGERLCELSPGQLSKLPVDDPDLLTAVHETRQIRSNSARRRHMQFIGKLMRGIDPEPIEQALARLDGAHAITTERQHRLEQWRERILCEGDRAIEEALVQFPGADRQRLRQLLLQHRRERSRDQPPAASRALFRYLREVQ